MADLHTLTTDIHDLLTHHPTIIDPSNVDTHAVATHLAADLHTTNLEAVPEALLWDTVFCHTKEKA